MVDYASCNPGFWNNDPNVRTRNNCYNYASNKRTDTFAQPGRGYGRMYTAITCAEVSRAALCDRLHRQFACFSDSEKPRYLVALLIAPGPALSTFTDIAGIRKGSGAISPGARRLAKPTTAAR